MLYTLTNTSTIIRDSDGANIPEDPTNVDYQQYLIWVAEGNTPNPYIAPPPPPELTIEEKLASIGLTITDLKTALGLK